jgi:hypothetical protein
VKLIAPLLLPDIHVFQPQFPPTLEFGFLPTSNRLCNALALLSQPSASRNKEMRRSQRLSLEDIAAIIESEADGAFEPADAATSTYEDADAAGDGSGEPSSGAADGEEIDGADEASGRGVFIVTPKGEAALRGAAA